MTNWNKYFVWLLWFWSLWTSILLFDQFVFGQFNLDQFNLDQFDLDTFYFYKFYFYKFEYDEFPTSFSLFLDIIYLDYNPKEAGPYLKISHQMSRFFYNQSISIMFIWVIFTANMKQILGDFTSSVVMGEKFGVLAFCSQRLAILHTHPSGCFLQLLYIIITMNHL